MAPNFKPIYSTSNQKLRIVHYKWSEDFQVEEVNFFFWPNNILYYVLDLTTLWSPQQANLSNAQCSRVYKKGVIWDEIALYDTTYVLARKKISAFLAAAHNVGIFFVIFIFILILIYFLVSEQCASIVKTRTTKTQE